MARIFTDEQLEAEIARHLLIFAEQQRVTALGALSDTEIEHKLGATGLSVLRSLLGVALSVGVSVAKHRAARAGLDADAILAAIPRHRPFRRPPSSGGTPDDTPPSDGRLAAPPTLGDAPPSEGGMYS